MGFLRISTQDALGLHIDGQLVQVAHLQRKGKLIKLAALKSASLISRLDLDQGEEEPGAVARVADAGDILGLDIGAAPEVEEPTGGGDGEEEEQPPETNSEVLYSLLGDFPLKACTLALSLQEGRVFFSEFEDSFELKGKKLKKRLLEEMQKERDLEGSIPLQERHAYFKTEHGKLLSIAHEDSLEVLNILDELKPFIGRVQIGLIDPLEIALMNLVRVAYPAEESVTAVVHLGQGFSRVIFMQNGDYLAFSQPIHEGGSSDQVLNTVCSRILFEQDVADIPELGRVLLSGDCKTLNALPFFTEQFSESQVDYLAVAEMDLGLPETPAQAPDPDAISDFAVPIGLAWKLLQPGSASFYPTNFLPKARKRQQNPLELAWHSLVLLALLLISFPLISLKAQQQDRTIQEIALGNQLAQQQLDEFNPYVKMVDDLYAQIQDYESNLALSDTLMAYQTDWSTRFHEWTGEFTATGQLWLDRFTASEGDVDIGGNWGDMDLSAPQEVFMYGKAISPTRAAEIARRLGDGQIRSLTRVPIRTQTVFQFDLIVPVSTGETDSTEP